MNNNPLLPPHDKKAERALIGSLLVDNEALNEVAAIVTVDDFYMQVYGLVYRTMLDLSARLEPVDIITVMSELRKLGHADIGEGQDRAEAFLSGLIMDAPPGYNAPYYARTIADAAQRRRLINTASRIASLSYDDGERTVDIIDEALNLIHDTAANQRGGRRLTPIGEGLSGYLDEMSERFVNPVEVSGLRTGYIDLDKLTNGLKPQELTIVAGRPGMGKTAILVGIAANLTINEGMRGAIFSLEMSKEELRDRLIAYIIGVDLQSLRRGDLNDSQQQAFYEVVGRLSGTQLYVNDLPGLTPAEILADARRVDTQNQLDFIMVDYLGLIGVPGSTSRYEQVSASARQLKNLAKQLNVPVIAAAQLNRGVEQRADKRPMLHDLRDSGEIEEAADCVLSVYRDGYYDEATASPNMGEIGILKQRNGPAGGKVKLYWRETSASYHNAEIHEVRL